MGIATLGLIMIPLGAAARPSEQKRERSKPAALYRNSGRFAGSSVEGRKGPSLGEWETFLGRLRTHALSISGMAFQDAWNLDLERLRDCCIHVVHPDGRIIPLCI